MIWLWVRLFLLLISILVEQIICAESKWNLQDDGVLVDGDIMFSANEDPSDRFGKITLMNKRWPGGLVPYIINETSYSLWDRFVIENAMDEFEDVSCIKFAKKTDEKDYISIQPLEGCWSYLGRQGSEQALSLAVPQCINKGTILHELMHALGFWHEHSRVDRDEYVQVHWDNVIDLEKQANFAKHKPFEMDYWDLPYDHQSLMHYDAWTFSKSRDLPTLTPKTKGVRLRDLGRAKTAGSFTLIDRNKLKQMYECPS